MTSVEAVRVAVSEAFDSVEDVGDNVLRAERRHEGRPYAIAYIDLSDAVIERAEHLAKFQDELLGPTYFDVEGNLRWNSYLYFWAGPRSSQHESFGRAKSHIERDRHYARKFVVSQDELIKRLARLSVAPYGSSSGPDVSTQWGEMLRSASLGVLLEQRPRTQVIDLIGSGKAFMAEARSVPHVAMPQSDPLQAGRLRTLWIQSFRPVNSGRDFQFGDVTLIFGPNGSGKTSLLEAVEALYCGRIRRDAEAEFRGIRAEVLTPSGTVVPVECTGDVATLKARNLSWYGRSDPQSHALLQGFSRFNFLDTDAAFRLSATSDSEQIKVDLSRLLVGADAAKLWSYLAKLEQEVASRRGELEGRLQMLRAQAEVLVADLARIRAAPTEARTLAKNYHAQLSSLSAQGRADADDGSVDPSERDRLETLCRGIDQAMASVRETPVTLRGLRDRLQMLEKALLNAQELAEANTKAVRDLEGREKQIRAHQGELQTLEQWARYCEAGAPTLAAELARVDKDLNVIRAQLGGHTLKGMVELPVEYGAAPLSDALELAIKRVHTSEEQERVALAHLQQSELLGASMHGLRKDLHDTAKALIQRSGDSLHCPLCQTEHRSADLLTKIAALAVAGIDAEAEGLRTALRGARDKAEHDRRIVLALKAIDGYSQRAGVPNTSPTEAVREELRLQEARLESLTDDLGRLQSATRALAAYGLSWDGYENAKNAVTTLLGTEPSSDVGLLRNTIEEMQGAVKGDQRAAWALREMLAEQSTRALAVLQSTQLNPSMGASPADAATGIERSIGQLKSVITLIEQAAHGILIGDDQPLETLRLALSEAILAFDKALHAERRESQSRGDLQEMSVALETQQRELLAVSQTISNLTRALTALSGIIREQSLDKATKETLDSIRQRVSDVFARIHAPSEYVLESFDSEVRLRTIGTGQRRLVSQVSTGQRAALALSIFVAMNESAASAPPVLLIDDPIAHIDDLNALSFLDYLRDLVLCTNRQVLFATADARLGALFERKFEFLGSERFKKCVLAR